MHALTLYPTRLVSKRETVRGSSARETDSPMECSALITLRSRVHPVFSRAQLTEILCGPENAGQLVTGCNQGINATNLGTISLNSSIFSLPAGVSPMLTSMKTIGRWVDVIVRWVLWGEKYK
jgi:hypothetical protein